MTDLTTQIKADMAALVVAMSEKGLVTPMAEAWIGAGNMTIHLKWNGSGSYKFLYAPDYPAALQAAATWINDLPDQQEAIHSEYMRKVSAAIDYGHEHSLDDKYVDPLRKVNKAMTDNLLTAEVSS